MLSNFYVHTANQSIVFFNTQINQAKNRITIYFLCQFAKNERVLKKRTLQKGASSMLEYVLWSGFDEDFRGVRAAYTDVGLSRCKSGYAGALKVVIYHRGIGSGIFSHKVVNRG